MNDGQQTNWGESKEPNSIYHASLPYLAPYQNS